MEAVAVVNDSNHDVVDDSTENVDFGFLPKNLTAQCQSFIQRHRQFRQLLRKASTTRSAKKSNEGFVRIATTLLSLEILASSFAGWSAIYPEAGSMARATLQRNAHSPHMPLMDFYLYPPKYISAAAIAALALPPGRQPDEERLYRTSIPELSGEKSALNYANAIHQLPA
jgi:hypothetical protein